MSKTRIAVVGAGIFGITIATRLDREGHSVTLFEEKGDILQCASLCNQYRLHRGYHYPRSYETAESCVKGTEQFKQEYPECVVEGIEQHYCIVNDERSKITGPQFLSFCDSLGLAYQNVRLDDLLHMNKFDVCVRVDETVFDWDILYRTCHKRLRESSVDVRMGTRFTPDMVSDSDFVVVATYARSNKLLDEFPEAQRDYQFEVCEKLILQLPPRFASKGIVIMDGPFMCIDVRGHTSQHLMGNVVHAIHGTAVARSPQCPPEYEDVMNNGIAKRPPLTHFDGFVESAREFYKFDRIEHLGSMFTFRTVLPYRDDTDERPTIVQRVGEKIISVFSGKIPNCVAAAEEVARIVK
ncbi:MAG TPA: FAD-dependent oxidoreductase [Phycisphaerae bacterium]|nr:FAD-dependent oxidoreductase [Phycisphaerae bacterium]